MSRALFARVVDGVFPCEDQLGNGNEGIALLCEIVEDGGESFGGVKPCIVKEDDGARLHLACDTLGDLGGGEILPVETVHIPYKGKPCGTRGDAKLRAG